MYNSKITQRTNSMDSPTIIQPLIKSDNEPCLETLDNVQKCRRSNHYILTGYRKNFNTFGRVVCSLFKVHNETFNVWSHLIGFHLFLIFIIYVPIVDKVPIYFGSQNVFDFEKAPTFKAYILNVRNELPDNMTKLEQVHHLILIIFNRDKWFKYIDSAEKFNIGTEQSIQDIKQQMQQLKESISQIDFNKNMILETLQEIQQLPVLIQFTFYEIYDSYKEINMVRQFNFPLIFIRSRNLKSIKKQSFNKQMNLKVNSEALDLLDLQHNKNKITANYRQARENLIPKWPLLVFFASACFCLGGSATFHLFSCLNEKVHHILGRLDYAGICVLIFGSVFPVYIYQFWCTPFYYKMYTAISGSVCLMVFIICMGEKIYRKENNTIKCWVFAILGISDALAGPQLIYLQYYQVPGNGTIPINVSGWLYILEGFWYLGGLTIYGLKIPERFFPKKFDFIVRKFIFLFNGLKGNSHNIWHCFVILGAFTHYQALLMDYHARVDTICPFQ